MSSFFSSITLQTDNGKRIPAGEEFSVRKIGPSIPGVQQLPALTLLVVSHKESFKHKGVHNSFNVYSTMGRWVAEETRIRYPALFGLAIAMGYNIDLVKMNGASLEKQEMQLLSYRQLTKHRFKVICVAEEAAAAYARGDSQEYMFLQAYENALAALREMFQSFQ